LRESFINSSNKITLFRTIWQEKRR
jgi:hypothetical protein